MPRYYLDEDYVRYDMPWDTSSYFANRLAVISLDEKDYWLVKLGAGSLQTAEPAPLMLFDVSSSGLVDVSGLLSAAQEFAVTRDLIVHDFNSDGFDDIFLSNHGPEIPQGFPGEQNAIYLYDRETSQYVETVFPRMDFSHGSSVGDFNGDGLLDLYIRNLGAVENYSDYLLLQNTDGSFERHDKPDDMDSLVGPLTTALDVDGDGQSELASVVGDGELVIWGNLVSSQYGDVINSSSIPITPKGVFELRTADFDSNGQGDVLVVGSSEEQFYYDSGNKVVTGGRLKAVMVFDAGTESESVVDLLESYGAGPMSQGGFHVELADFDSNGLIDVQITSSADDWSALRFEFYSQSDQSFEVVEYEGRIYQAESTQTSHIDVNNDGVLDVVSISDGVYVRFGRLLDRYDNRAYDLDGHAGETAKILGAVFGAESITNQKYVGIGLSLLDDGMEYEQLA